MFPCETSYEIALIASPAAYVTIKNTLCHRRKERLSIIREIPLDTQLLYFMRVMPIKNILPADLFISRCLLITSQQENLKTLSN